MTGTCKFCGGPEHTGDKELAVEVFVDRYRRSGVRTLHEFAAAELMRLAKQVDKEMREHLDPKDLANYMRVVTEGTFEIILAVQDYLRRNTH